MVFAAINAMLKLDPSKRPTVEQLLKMPAFTTGSPSRRGSVSNLLTMGNATLFLTAGTATVPRRLRVSIGRLTSIIPHDVYAYNLNTTNSDLFDLSSQTIHV
jgi:hypothetical protein